MTTYVFIINDSALIGKLLSNILVNSQQRSKTQVNRSYSQWEEKVFKILKI